MAFSTLIETLEPDRTYGLFVRAIEIAHRNNWSRDVVAQLKILGHPEWAQQLEELASKQDAPSSAPLGNAQRNTPSCDLKRIVRFAEDFPRLTRARELSSRLSASLPQ